MREFLTYLEEKNIINTERLENNKEEMNNLIKDLMKLDLQKFSKQRSNSNSRKNTATNNGSPNINSGQASSKQIG